MRINTYTVRYQTKRIMIKLAPWNGEEVWREAACHSLNTIIKKQQINKMCVVLEPKIQSLSSENIWPIWKSHNPIKKRHVCMYDWAWVKLNDNTSSFPSPFHLSYKKSHLTLRPVSPPAGMRGGSSSGGGCWVL